MLVCRAAIQGHVFEMIGISINNPGLKPFSGGNHKLPVVGLFSANSCATLLQQLVMTYAYPWNWL